MNTVHHNQLVDQQFGPRAAAYLHSAVHASGQDLDCMAQLVGERPAAIALDMGCGGGHAAFRLAGQVAKVVAYDLSAPMLAAVAQEAGRRGIDNIVTKQGAAETLPCPTESFDVVVTRYSAHHWHALEAGLAQMRRTLKQDGLGIFMDVVSPEAALLNTWLQTMELLRDPSHVRNASLTEWKRLLQTAGFAVEQIHTFRLRLDFDTWIERMQTPPVHAAAIRSLQQRADEQVRSYFALEEDGSFTVDTMVIAARPIAATAQ